MSTILVTGTSGFIGRALAASLAEKHEVVCISRKNTALDLPQVMGCFYAFEDLRALDRYKFNAVVHLAAVTGGCLERDGFEVNVEGTRCLMRYLIDRGCKKFVMASSIAAVGFQNVHFRPLAVPIPDEHPCLDRDGYGVSKYLMEEVSKYYARQHAEIDVINLRLATVFPEDAAFPRVAPGPVYEWALGSITVMALSDAVRAFTLAAEAPHSAGVRIMNAAPPKACVAASTEAVLRAWYPDTQLDYAHYQQSGHQTDSAFDVRRIREELGFEARVLPPV